MITVQNRYLFYKVKLKLSSLLERLWLPKLDRCKFWERSPGNTPPRSYSCHHDGVIGLLKNIYSFAHLSVLVFVKSLDKVVTMGRSATCFSVLQRYTCCPILLTNWSLSRMKILQHCFIKLTFQPDTVSLSFQGLQYLCHVYL